MMTGRTNYSQAIDDVVTERLRQVDSEGFGPAHDDRYHNWELARAGVCYATVATHKDRTRKESAKRAFAPGTWPWHLDWWKPKDRRRDLVRAAALLIAEIERMDRAELAVELENKCPVCAEPMKPDDTCSTDIELGICHAACLEGSPTVNLDTGEPMYGPIPTYRYGDVMGRKDPAQ
jgi:hypothetical protein